MAGPEQVSGPTGRHNLVLAFDMLSSAGTLCPSPRGEGWTVAHTDSVTRGAWWTAGLDDQGRVLYVLFRNLHTFCTI